MAETKNPAAGSQPAPGSVIAPGEAAPEPVTPDPQPEPKFTAESAEQPSTAVPDSDGQGVTWTASEFVRHDKSASWYVSLAITTVLLAGLIFLITRDAVSVAVIVVAGLLLGIYAARQPRQLEYHVGQNGVFVGAKHHGYDEFKSFSVVPEGAFSSVVFMPLKRFAPSLTIYYAPEDEERIIAVLADQLPLEEPRRDAVDSLMRRIRF